MLSISTRKLQNLCYNHYEMLKSYTIINIHLHIIIDQRIQLSDLYVMVEIPLYVQRCLCFFVLSRKRSQNRYDNEAKEKKGFTEYHIRFVSFRFIYDNEKY